MAEGPGGGQVGVEQGIVHGAIGLVQFVDQAAQAARVGATSAPCTSSARGSQCCSGMRCARCGQGHMTLDAGGKLSFGIQMRRNAGTLSQR